MIAQHGYATMKILATNDDGIDAAGLALLVRALAPWGEVTVVAPSEEHSGCGHQVTTQRPLRVEQEGSHRYRVDGTPADCIRLGLLEINPATDWVVAGVNPGGNLGVDVYMSGTVAAVREAALFGKPAIAWSRYQRDRTPVDWEILCPQVQKVFECLTSLPWKSGMFWNVNFPDPEDKTLCPQMVTCPLELAHVPIQYQCQQGQYYFQGNYQDRPRNSGSDVDICFSDKIAVTQLTVC